MKILVLTLAISFIFSGWQASAEPYPLISPAVQDRIDDYNIKLRKPGYNINSKYANSRVPIGDFLAGDYDIDASDLFPLEKSIQDINNRGYDTEIIKGVVESLIADIQQDVDVLARLLGYHEYVAPSASLVSSNQIAGWPVTKYVLSGRYGQFLEAYCAFEDDREGLLVLLPGRGADVRAMWNLGLPLDYMNHAAWVYHQRTSMNVCALTIYNLPDVPLYRYGLTGRGVGITIIKDFITWAIPQQSADFAGPIIIGGTSNGGHMAEFAAILDDRIDGVISSGAAARYNYPLSHFADISLAPTALAKADGAYIGVNMLRSASIYRLVHPKALLVSVGTHDAGLTFSGYPDKFDQLHEAKQTYGDRSNCLAINLFLGQHAMDPRGDAPLLNQLLENCL